MAYFLYLLLAFFFTLLGYLMEYGALAILLQPAELIMACIPPFFFALGATSGRAFGLSWKLVFGGPVQADRQGIKQACRYLNVYGTTSAIMGGIGATLGIIITSGAWDVPAQVFGEHLGASLVALLYGTTFKTLCYVAEQRIKDRYLEVAG